MLNALICSKNKLSMGAISLIRQFIKHTQSEEGGFKDKAGKSDIYYSVFGYSLSFLFEIDLNYEVEKKYLVSISNSNLDFVHAISFLRCVFLLEVINYSSKNPRISKIFSGSSFITEQITQNITEKIKKEYSQVFARIEMFKSGDGGFNQNKINAEFSTVYANFLGWTFLKDIESKLDEYNLANLLHQFSLPSGGYVNEIGTNSVLTTTTSAAIIMKYLIHNEVEEKAMHWLYNQQNNLGGFVAGNQLSIADILSTSSAVLALSVTNNMDLFDWQKCIQFIDMHWDKSGGFIGSISDSNPDCEYTFYALMALGLILSS